MKDPNDPRRPSWGPLDNGTAGTGPPGHAGSWQPPQAPPPRNGLGISALILGIIGLLAGTIPLLFWMAAVLGIIAVVLGLVGARRAKQGYATNRRMSFIGVVLGVLAIVLSVIGALIVNDAFEDLERELDTARTAALAALGTGTPSGD